jgi:hypothetical protein
VSRLTLTGEVSLVTQPGTALRWHRTATIEFVPRHGSAGQSDILNLYVATDLPLPAKALPQEADPWGSEPPF